MKNIFMKKLLILSVLSFTAISSSPLYAQDNLVHGEYNPRAPKYEEKGSSVPVPKVFSQKIQHSVVQAMQVDSLYQNLKIALWNYAQVGFTQQSVMIEKMATDNFQTTRRKAEFSKPIDTALTSLNSSYKGMNEQITKANESLEIAIHGVTAAEEDIIRTLWDEKIKELKKSSDDYFKMQHTYILNFQKLSKFVIKKNGSYFFDDKSHSLRFLDGADYTYFASTIDKLNAMTLQQKKFLKDLLPNAAFLAIEKE